MGHLLDMARQAVRPEALPAPSFDAPDILPDHRSEARRRRVLAMLAEHSEARYAVVTDADSDPASVILALAIRGRGTCELHIPRDRYDGILLLDLIDRHAGTVH